MIQDFSAQLSALVCPRCRAGLGRVSLAPETESLACPACGETYPHRQAMLILFYVDDSWFWPLHEFLAYHTMREKVETGGIEENRLAMAAQFFKDAGKTTEEMTEAGIASLGAHQGRLVLDAACGCCGLSKTLSDRGFRLIALDLNVSDLLFPRSTDGTYDAPNAYAAYLDKSRAFPPEEIRFLRVAGNLLNLPIRDGGVDAVFSRAMLHHLDPLVPAMEEIGRVLKPGGVWVASAEPSAGLLDWEPDSIVDWSIEYEEGVHEQFPRLWTYYRGFRAGGMEVEQFNLWEARYRLNLGLRRRRRFRLSWVSRPMASPERRVLPFHQMIWMNCVGNFTARRTTAPPPRRALDPSRRRFAKPEWFLDPARHIQELRAALRQLVPVHKLANPARLGRLRHPEIQLTGFQFPERVEGRLVRYPTGSATIYLPPPKGGGPRVCWLEYFTPTAAASQAITARASVNGRPLGTINQGAPGPHRVEFPIAPELLREPGAVEIAFTFEGAWRDAAGRVLRLPIERVGIQ